MQQIQEEDAVLWPQRQLCDISLYFKVMERGSEGKVKGRKGMLYIKRKGYVSNIGSNCLAHPEHTVLCELDNKGEDHLHAQLGAKHRREVVKERRSLHAVLLFCGVVGQALDDGDEIGLEVLVVDDIR